MRGDDRTEGMIGIIDIQYIYPLPPPSPSPHSHFKLGCAPWGHLALFLLLPTGELPVVPAPFPISGGIWPGPIKLSI